MSGLFKVVAVARQGGGISPDSSDQTNAYETCLSYALPLQSACVSSRVVRRVRWSLRQREGVQQSTVRPADRSSSSSVHRSERAPTETPPRHPPPPSQANEGEKRT